MSSKSFVSLGTQHDTIKSSSSSTNKNEFQHYLCLDSGSVLSSFAKIFMFVFSEDVLVCENV